jgi:hypothetical protein
MPLSEVLESKPLDLEVFFLVPTRRRGNPFGTRQRPVYIVQATLARRQSIPTQARGNEEKNFDFGLDFEGSNTGWLFWG